MSHLRGMHLSSFQVQSVKTIEEIELINSRLSRGLLKFLQELLLLFFIVLRMTKETSMVFITA